MISRLLPLLAMFACSANAGPAIPNHQETGPGTVTRTIAKVLADYPKQLRSYGAVCDGSTDDTSALNSAIADVYRSGGGTILLPVGRCLIAGRVSIPNSNDAAYPTQPPIRLTGEGSTAMGYWTFPEAPSASTLDLRYNDPVAKLNTQGAGTLEIDHLGLVDGGTDCAVFIQSTNTTLHIHDVWFSGTHQGLNACNDAVVLGGTGTRIGPGDNAAFQGFQTVIESNFFDKTRRAVWCRSDCNGNTIRDNTVSATAGNSTGAVVEFQGADVVGHQASGNWIAGNCAELTNYQYFAKLTNAPENTFLGNSLWDIAGNTASFFFLDSASGAASVPGLIQQAHYDYITPLTSGPGAGGAGYHIVSRETYWGGTSHTFLSPVTFNSTATFNTDMTLAGVTKITNASGLYIQTSGMANVNISAGNGAAQGLVQLDSVGNFFFRNSQQSSGGLYFDFPSSGAVSFRSGGSSTVAQISSTGADFSGLRIQYLASVAAGPTFAFSANSCAASVQAGGATAGRYQSGTTGTCSIALLLPNAPHEWFCTATNITNPANTIRQTTISGSGPVLSGTTAAGDQIQFACTSY